MNDVILLPCPGLSLSKGLAMWPSPLPGCWVFWGGFELGLHKHKKNQILAVGLDPTSHACGVRAGFHPCLKLQAAGTKHGVASGRGLCRVWDGCCGPSAQTERGAANSTHQCDGIKPET